MDYILETHGLTKVYGQKTAVNNVDLHIREGQIYGLIGRNGAGKTTIMRMISGLATPTRGEYSLFGKTGPEMRKELRNVGVLIEDPGIFPRLSAYENLKIKCIAMGIRPEGYVEEMLKTVGLERTDRKKPSSSYSLGMRQRLGIGLALVGEPKLIVLDEPINGLDPQGIAEVRETLARLRDQKGITMMISSHILDELSKLADVYGIIHEGSLIDEFTVEQLHARSEQYVKIRTDNDEAAVRALAGMGLRSVFYEHGTIRVTERLDETAAMAKAIVDAGVGLREMYVNVLSLEDYFLRMTGGNYNG
ncbi:MAG: ATP-binding cassette domain-containing protein [Lachnospiraceae bacterium]|nr:ATP-binding cassette domain-containing protein [Lachnospiraceae bacterium]